MAFSLCIWGLDDPWNWGPTTGNLWRTSNDISFTQGSVAWSDILKNFDSATLHANAQAPGAYNDPDMMEVGASGISDTESQSHFSLWAIAGAPLLAGNDITNMSSTTQSILTNSEVIAVDQDPLDPQGIKVSEPSIGLQVWSKVLSTAGQRAVVLLNRTSATANITVQWNDLGLAAGSTQVRDLWAHSNLGSFSNSYTASVSSHGVAMLKITGTEGAQATYEAESSANTLSGSAAVETCSFCSGGKDVGYIGNGTSGSNGTLQFNNINVSTAGSHQLVISYVNGDSSTYGIGTSRTASISINGGTAFTVSFPATGDWNEVVTNTIMINLNAGNNTIKFSNSSAWTPDIDKIDVA